jgi:dTDP-4-dehydrorhamnose 3,5-epimerase-like enzyme
VEPRLIKGNFVVDDRGGVGFVNDFNFADVKRFYWLTNHAAGFVRAWHAHKNEAKFVTVVQGTALAAAVKIDDWETPSKDSEVMRFTLSAQSPSVLYIPAGYGNGAMSLTADAKIMYFSTATIEDSTGDDFRYPARYWDVWNVEER